jgi:hypothetical protein
MSYFGNRYSFDYVTKTHIINIVVLLVDILVYRMSQMGSMVLLVDILVYRMSQMGSMVLLVDILVYRRDLSCMVVLSCKDL